MRRLLSGNRRHFGRGRTHYPVCGLLWPHTAMATPVGARMASARGAIRMHKCFGDPRHWFAPTTPAGRIVDACTTRRVDFYGPILLWPPQNAHEWPMHAPRLGSTNVSGTSDTGLHPLRPLFASWTHAPCGVWTSMATYFYGHVRTRTNGPCTRRGWDAHLLGGPPTLVCIHHAGWSRRGRMHHPVCGLLWPHTSMATPERARMARACGVVGMHKCFRDPRHWLAPTTPAGRVVDACTTRCVDFSGHRLLWPPRNAHEWPVHAVRFGRTNVGGTPDTVLHPPRPLVDRGRTHYPVCGLLWPHTSTAPPSTPTNGQCTRGGWNAQMLGGPPTLVCTLHARWSRRGRTHYPACGLIWTQTSMATPVRARMAGARAAVGTH